MVVIHALLLSAALAVPPEASELPEPLASRYAEAMALVRDGRHAEVSALLAEVIAGAPDFDHAYRNRCVAERSLGHGDVARSLCEQAVALDGGWVNQAALIRDMLVAKDIDAAVSTIDAALKAQPDEVQLLRLKCDTALASADPKALQIGVEGLERVEPDGQWAPYYRFLLEVRLGHRDEALAAQEKALATALPRRYRARMGQTVIPPEPPPVPWMWILSALAVLAGGLGAGRLWWNRARKS